MEPTSRREEGIPNQQCKCFLRSLWKVGEGEEAGLKFKEMYCICEKNGVCFYCVFVLINYLVHFTLYVIIIFFW